MLFAISDIIFQVVERDRCLVEVNDTILQNQVKISNFVLLIFLDFSVVILCVFTLWGSCCDVRYDFHIKTMFASSLPPVVYRRAHALFPLFVLFLYNDVQLILCCVFVLFVFVLFTLCCQFLWIFHFLYCPFGIL